MLKIITKLDADSYIKLFIKYFFPLIIAFVSLYTLFKVERDTEIIQNYFPTLISIQASILVLAVTMALIAAQIVSTSYSLHIITVFKSSRELQVFFSSYTICMIFELYSLLYSSNISQDFHINNIIGFYTPNYFVNIEYIQNNVILEQNILDINWGIILLLFCSLFSIWYFYQCILDILSPKEAVAQTSKDLYINH